ncbi:unnamed protein product [Tilletia controversa]|nr:unnamed protein product [Tilletia controversa]
MPSRQMPAHGRTRASSGGVISPLPLSSVAPSPGPTPLDTLLNNMDETISSMHRSLQRMEGRMDTVEDAVTSLEARMARVAGRFSAYKQDPASRTERHTVFPATPDCSLPTLKLVPKPSAAASSPTIIRNPPSHLLLRASSTAPRPQVLMSEMEPAAALMAAMDRAPTSTLLVPTSAPAIFPLVFTRNPPPHMTQLDSSNTSRPPRSVSVPARPFSPNVPPAFEPPLIRAMVNDALLRLSGLLGASVRAFFINNDCDGRPVAQWHRGMDAHQSPRSALHTAVSDTGNDGEPRRWRAHLQPHCATPTPPPLSTSPFTSTVPPTTDADDAGPRREVRLRAASGSAGDDFFIQGENLSTGLGRLPFLISPPAPPTADESATSLSNPSASDWLPVTFTGNPDAEIGYNFSLSSRGLVSRALRLQEGRRDLQLDRLAGLQRATKRPRRHHAHSRQGLSMLARLARLDGDRSTLHQLPPPAPGHLDSSWRCCGHDNDQPAMGRPTGVIKLGFPRMRSAA